jgi:hypothetical protein
VNRVLHGPTLRLRQAASERTAETLSLEHFTLAIEELFQLSQSESLTEDTDMPLYDEPRPSDPYASPPEPEVEVSATETASPKRRAHSEAP